MIARIEGTGIKDASKKSQRMAGEKKVASSVSGGSSGGNYVDAGDARGFVSIEQATKMLANPERYKMRPKEVQYLRGSMPVDMVKAPTEKSKIRTGDQFSPVVSDMDVSPSLGATEGSLLARADIQSLSVPGSEAFNNEVDQYERNMQKTTTSDQFGEKGTDERQQNIGDSYKIYRQFRYENDPGGYIRGQDFSKNPAKEKTIGERVADFTGKVFNTVTGTQSAIAQTKGSGEGMFSRGVPTGTYSQFSPTSKPQYQVNREKNRPNQNTNTAEAGAGVKFGSVNLNVARGIETPSEDTSFSSYVRGARPGQERGNTGLAQARKVANRNPNVSINKSTGRAEATNDSGKAKAQALATNRIMSGGGGPKQSGAERAKAAYRRNIKKGHKGTASAAAANKASMRRRAKARHKARKKSKSKK